jgi:hypothetical protein
LPNEEYKRINTFGSAVTSIKDTSLLTGTAYTYRIKAFGDRTESPFTSAGATTPSLLEIPAISITVVYNNALKVDWKSVPDATGYQVERRSPDQAYQKVGAGTFDPSVMTFSDTSLSPGIAYTYRIKAIGNKTESPTASASAVTPSMLSTPDLVVTPTSFDALALSWKATPNVAYYSLERKMPGAGTYQVIVKKIEPAQTRYVDTLLLHSTEYHYRLVAFGDKTQSAGALANGTTLVLLATSQEPVVTMNIWPNPAIGGQTSLRFSGPVSGTVRIVDLRGVVYAQHTLVNATQMPLALPNYQAGVYLVQVEAEKNVLVQRLLIH